MNSAKQRFLMIFLVVIFVISIILMVSITMTLSAEANSGYMDVPQITVLTHGLGG